MLIDIHAHIGEHPQNSYSSGALAAYVESCAVDMALVSNFDAARPPGARDLDEVDANSAVLDAARACAWMRPVYWVRPGRSDSHVHAIAGALGTAPFAAVMLAPALNDFDVAGPDLDPLWRLLAKLEVPALVRVAAESQATPSRVYAAARKHPRLTTILLSPPGPTSIRGECVDVIRHAAARGDAALYLSTAHWVLEEIVRAVRSAGADRVLYGSDAAAHGDSHAARCQDLLARLRGELSPADFAQFSGAAAAHALGLGEPAHA